MGADAPARGPATGGGTAPTLFSGRLKRRCNGGNTVTETALQRRNAVTLADRAGEHVGDEEADGLRLLILVGACGAFRSRAPQSRGDRPRSRQS